MCNTEVLNLFRNKWEQFRYTRALSYPKPGLVITNPHGSNIKLSCGMELQTFDVGSTYR